MVERLYLDSCVLNRAADDQSQERVRLETGAIAEVFDLIVEGEAEWVASSALRIELSRTQDAIRRGDSLRLLSFAAMVIVPETGSYVRGRELTTLGLDSFDALHLALAEQAGVTTLLTVDDRFIRKSSLALVGSRVKVENPVEWMRRRKPWLVK